MNGGYVSTNMHGRASTPIPGVLRVALRLRGSCPRGAGSPRGYELTLPEGGPRKRPRPLAADRRDLSWDAHGQGWAEMGAHSFRRGMGKFTAVVCKPELGEGGRPGVPCVQLPQLELPRPPPRPPCLLGAVPRSRVRRALPSGAARTRPEGSGSAYLRALGPAAKAGGKLPRPAGEHRCGRLCGLAVRVRAGASVCAPVYAPSGPAGGVRRATPPASSRRRRRRPHLQEAHRWLLAPTLTEPPLSIRTPLRPGERQQHAPQGPAGAAAGAQPVPLAVVLNGQLRAPRVRPPPQTLAMQPPPQLLCSSARHGDPFAPLATHRANTFPEPLPISW